MSSIRPKTRVAMSLAIGCALAPLPPLYPFRSLLRSFLEGGGGDRIDDIWSLRSVFGLIAGFRYDKPTTLVVLLDLGVFLVLAAAIAFVVNTLISRLRRTS